MSLPSMLVMGGDKGYKGRCRRISQTPSSLGTAIMKAMTMRSFVTDYKKIDRMPPTPSSVAGPPWVVVLLGTQVHWQEAKSLHDRGERGRHARPIIQPDKQRSSGSCAIFVDTASGDADSCAVWTLNALPFRKKLHLSRKKKKKKYRCTCASQVSSVRCQVLRFMIYTPALYARC